MVMQLTAALVAMWLVQASPPPQQPYHKAFLCKFTSIDNVVRIELTRFPEVKPGALEEAGWATFFVSGRSGQRAGFYLFRLSRPTLPASTVARGA
jgi:hypothetical protein